jgi:hypothetical protein
MAGTISYTLTEQEIVSAHRLHYLRGAVSKRSASVVVIAGVIIGLIHSSAYFDAGYVGDGVISFATTCGVILAGWILLVALGCYAVGVQAERLFRQQRTLRGETRTTWSDERLELDNSFAAAGMAWADYHSWRQERPGYLIYHSDYYYYLLPRRAFTDEQWADLEDTLVRSGLHSRGRTAVAARPTQPRVASQRASALRWWRDPRSRPGRIALWWVICTALCILYNALFKVEGHGEANAILYVPGAQFLAGLLAAWVLQLRSRTLELVEAFLQLTIVYVTIFVAFELMSVAWSGCPTAAWLGVFPSIVTVLFLAHRYRHSSRIRIFLAMLLALAVNAVGATFSQTDVWWWQRSTELRSRLHLEPPPDPEEPAIDAMRDIPPDRLWGAQPGLVDRAVDNLSSRLPGRSNVYAMGVAADGTQQLFAREARLALKVAKAHFGGNYRGGVLLSNGLADVLHSPFATQVNMAAAAHGVGDRIDPAHDVAFIYMASHGSRDAELLTNLPIYDALTPLSAASVADTLARSGIKRRVIVISACYSGSWIPALINDDTIVITAARKDRRSFGCDDGRQVTSFGDAFLDGPLARRGSLREAFEVARKTVARWEAKDQLTPSEPQAYVGRNMQAIWTERGLVGLAITRADRHSARRR